MNKFINNYKEEIVEYIEEVCTKHGVDVGILKTNDDLLGFLLVIDREITDVIALDPNLSFSDCTSILPETNTLQELKTEIEKAVFELTAYHYLATILTSVNASFTFNRNEYGYVVSCEISSTSDVIYEVFLNYATYTSAVYVEDEDGIITYDIYSSNINKMNFFICSEIYALIFNGDIDTH